MVRKNRFTKAIKHIKSTEIDEKIAVLEAAPTNNTAGVYAKGPGGLRLGKKDPARTFYPDTDGNWPSGIPGEAGEVEYVRPEGYWDGGPGTVAATDWDTISTMGDFSDAPLASSNTNTTTLIKADGTVLAALPPGGRSFIQGPLVDGYVPNHGYDNYINIGFIEKDTRELLLLGRLSATSSWESWDGTATNFTAINPKFTLEMAQWMKARKASGKTHDKIHYHYSGGTPQDTTSGGDADGMKYGNGWPGEGGSGGTPNSGTPQDPPEHGPWDPKDPPNAKDPEGKKDDPDDKDKWEAYLEKARAVDKWNKDLVDKMNAEKNQQAAAVAVPFVAYYGWKSLAAVVAIAIGAGYTESAIANLIANWNGIYEIKNPFRDKRPPKPKAVYGRTWVWDKVKGKWVSKSNTKPKDPDQELLDRVKDAVKKDKPQPNTDSPQHDSNRNPKKRFPGGANWANSYEPEGQLISESARRQLREIKKPYELKETPVQKLRKYRPNFKGKFSPQNTPDKTATKESDDLVSSAIAKGKAWSAKDRYWKGYGTVATENKLYDRVGHGDLAWDMIIADAKEKNGWKNREIQEQLNRIYHEKAMREECPDYESPWGTVIHEQGASTKQELDTVMKDPIVKKVAKRLRKEIDYPDKPARQGYPDKPPAKQIDGWHPEYGKKYKYDKLDPVSAKAMPMQGNPEIDANIKKARQQPKVKEEYAVDWRSSKSFFNLAPNNKTLLDGFNTRKDDLHEKMTVASTFTATVAPASGDVQSFQTGLTGEGGIDFGETGVNDSTLTGEGEFTAYTMMGNIMTAEDPTGVGRHLRHRDFDFGVGSKQSIHGGTYATSMAIGVGAAENQVPGYVPYSFRLCRPTGTWTGDDPYENTKGYTVDELGRVPGHYNFVDDQGRKGYGTALHVADSGWFATKDIDTSEVDTIKLHAYAGSGTIQSAAKATQVYYWAGNKPGFKSVSGDTIYAGGEIDSNKPNDGWRPLNQKPDGTFDNTVSTVIIPHDRPSSTHSVLSAYTQKIPEWCRGKNSRFIIFAPGTAAGFSMTSLRFQRRGPVNVVVSLDRPEATSFVRLGQASTEITSPKQRKKKVDNLLKSSKQYVNKVVANPFPGTDVEVGEAQGTGKPYITQKWDNKMKEFGDVGTLKQQRGKFVGLKQKSDKHNQVRVGLNR